MGRLLLLCSLPWLFLVPMSGLRPSCFLESQFVVHDTSIVPVRAVVVGVVQYSVMFCRGRSRYRYGYLVSWLLFVEHRRDRRTDLRVRTYEGLSSSREIIEEVAGCRYTEDLDLDLRYNDMFSLRIAQCSYSREQASELTRGEA